MRLKNALSLLICLLTTPLAIAATPAIGTIERLDPRFDQLVPRDAVLEKLAEGFKWSEGPVWVGQPGLARPAATCSSPTSRTMR